MNGGGAANSLIFFHSGSSAVAGFGAAATPVLRSGERLPEAPHRVTRAFLPFLFVVIPSLSTLQGFTATHTRMVLAIIVSRGAALVCARVVRLDKTVWSGSLPLCFADTDVGCPGFRKDEPGWKGDDLGFNRRTIRGGRREPRRNGRHGKALRGNVRWGDGT